MKKLILLYFVAWCVLFSLDAKPRTIKYKDGSIYVGDVIKRNPNGEGEMTYPDGTTLKGYWENGSCIRGTQELSNGDIFEGSFKNGVWDNGTLTENKTKNVYQGSFIHNRLNGQGKLVCADGKSYEGLWKDGSIKSGVMYNQGLVFEGTFVSFKPRTGKIDGVYKNKHRLHGEIIEGEVASGSYEYLLDSTKINFENARTCYGTIDLPEKRMKIRGWFKPGMTQRYIFSSFSFINGKETEIDYTTDKYKYTISGVWEKDSLLNPTRIVQESLKTGEIVNLDVNILRDAELNDIPQLINLTEMRKYKYHDYDVYVDAPGTHGTKYKELTYEYVVINGEKKKHGKFYCNEGEGSEWLGLEEYLVPYFEGEYYNEKNHGRWKFKIIHNSYSVDEVDHSFNFKKREIWTGEAEFNMGYVKNIKLKSTKSNGEVLEEYKIIFGDRSKLPTTPYHDDGDIRYLDYYAMYKNVLGLYKTHLLFDKDKNFDGLCSYTDENNYGNVDFTLEYSHGILKKATKDDHKNRVLTFDAEKDYEPNFRLPKLSKLTQKNACPKIGYLFESGLQKLK